MISKETALSNAKKYVKDKNRSFKRFNENLDKIILEKELISCPFSKFYEEERDIYTIVYYTEGYFGDQPYFVIVDAETGEVLHTITKHGYAEDWED